MSQEAVSPKIFLLTKYSAQDLHPRNTFPDFHPRRIYLGTLFGIFVLGKYFPRTFILGEVTP
jgi:hypothetical protein